MYRNNGNKTFTDWTEQTGLGGSEETTAAVLSDINSDRAVDLVVAGSGSAPLVYINPREGKFKGTPLFDETGLAATVGIYIVDFNKDGWMDIAVTHAGAPGISLWRSVEESVSSVFLYLSKMLSAPGELHPLMLITTDGWISRW